MNTIIFNHLPNPVSGSCWTLSFSSVICETCYTDDSTEFYVAPWTLDPKLFRILLLLMFSGKYCCVKMLALL